MKSKRYIDQLFCVALLAGILALLTFCSDAGHYTIADHPASIFPDYTGTTIPCNIAPLNFQIKEHAEKFKIRISGSQSSIDITSRNATIQIPVRKWRKFLSAHHNQEIIVQIDAKTSQEWIRYPEWSFFVAPDSIDSYLVYRLIEPGYELWGRMGIYQRCLESFDESPIMVNTLVDNNCMNCHSFCKGNPEMMLFHMRQNYPGTVIARNGSISQVNTKFPDEISAGVYPRWHPDGRHVAFSVNTTQQSFHMKNPNILEVHDKASDIILYDIDTHTITSNEAIHAADRFETYPEWSPNGRYLYFCSAPAKDMPQMYDSLYYDLFRVSFDPVTGTFGTKVDTIVAASKMGKSIAFPRISPDGLYLVFCMSGYGTFPIWHHDNDLYLLELNSGKLTSIDDVNSDQSDSYHTWSSNGRWMIFSSRRLDGLYTRPFIFYFDDSGKAHKPFLLPQKDPVFYDYFMKSYNVPELVTGKVNIKPQKIERMVKK